VKGLRFGGKLFIVYEFKFGALIQVSGLYSGFDMQVALAVKGSACSFDDLRLEVGGLGFGITDYRSMLIFF
jgi:hypothetical protein